MSLSDMDALGHNYDLNLSAEIILTNRTNSSYSERETLPNEMRGIFILLQILVAITGLCGNSLVIYVVLRFSKMQTVTNMYLFNLAVADEIFLSGLPAMIYTLVETKWPFGETLCRIYYVATSINQFSSSLLLTVMSADRYIAVCHPLSSPRYRTPFVAKLICLTVWTVAALLVSPVIVYTQLLPRPDGEFTCQIDFPSYFLPGFTLYTLVLGFVVPFSLIFLFYFLVICKLRTVGPKHKSKEKKRSHRKVTILVLTVISVYLVCWTPYWCSQIYIAYFANSHGPTGTSIIMFAGCLIYVNSALNPILYAFLSDNFKKSFVKAFTCAAGNDVNATLHVENSVFPKATRCSSHGRHGHGSAGFNGRTGNNGLGEKEADDQGNGDTQVFVNLINQSSHLGNECGITGITEYDLEELDDGESRSGNPAELDENELRPLGCVPQPCKRENIAPLSGHYSHAHSSLSPLIASVTGQSAQVDSPLSAVTCGSKLSIRNGNNQLSDPVDKSPIICNGFSVNGDNPCTQTDIKVDISEAKALLN